MTDLIYLCFYLIAKCIRRSSTQSAENVNYTICSHPRTSSIVTFLSCWNFRFRELYLRILKPRDTKIPIKTLSEPIKYQQFKLLGSTSLQSRQGINTVPQGFKRRFSDKDLQTLSDDITSPGSDAKKGEKFTT